MKIKLSVLAGVLALLPAAGFAQGSKEDKKDPATVVIEDQVSNDDPRDLATNTPCKIHVVKLTKDKTYVVTMQRKDSKQGFNPLLRVEDKEFKQLAIRGGVTARIRFTPLEDGDYRFIATTQGGLGNYILKITPVELIKPYIHDPAKVHEVPKKGLEYESNLDAKDEKDTSRQQMFRKVFLVKFQKKKTYVIEMDSDQFDSYLRLEDSTKKQLAEDDDSGGFPNARIVFQAPEEGVYRIITTTFAGNAQGQFTLRVREE